MHPFKDSKLKNLCSGVYGTGLGLDYKSEE